MVLNFALYDISDMLLLVLQNIDNLLVNVTFSLTDLFSSLMREFVSC